MSTQSSQPSTPTSATASKTSIPLPPQGKISKFMSSLLDMNGDDEMQELCLARSGITDEQLGELANTKQWNTIKLLDLEGNSGITSESIELLAALISTSRHLRVVNLSFTNIIQGKNFSTLAQAIGTSPSLAIMSLRNVKLGDSAIEVLCKHLTSKSTLRQLNLYKCELHDRGINVLCEAITSKKLKLSSLDLGGNRFQTEGIISISNLLSEGESQIEALHLRHLGINSQDVTFISEKLAANKTLHVLDLRANRIGYDGAERICQALKENSTLEILDLQRNQLNNKSLDVFLDMASTNNCINTIALKNNSKITGSDVDSKTKLLKQMLQKNKDIVKLGVELQAAEACLQEHGITLVHEGEEHFTHVHMAGFDPFTANWARSKMVDRESTEGEDSEEAATDGTTSPPPSPTAEKAGSEGSTHETFVASLMNTVKAQSRRAIKYTHDMSAEQMAEMSSPVNAAFGIGLASILVAVSVVAWKSSRS